jgi:aldose 1-epimerase
MPNTGEAMVLAAPPSGKQFSLELGSSTAVVTQVGGGLRNYWIEGMELLDGYHVDEICSGARGQTFITWPNRIADGRYVFRDVAHQLPLTEPSARNAIHGLTRWTGWHLVSSNGHSVTLHCLLHARPGYPFPLRCQISYRLRARGLAVETRTTDTGTTPCPYARHGGGLGVEPMTAAPNAFVTGDGLVSLAPGETHTATWELRPGGH